MSRRPLSVAPSYSFVQIAVGTVVGLFAFGAFVHRPGRRASLHSVRLGRDARVPVAPLLTAPSAVLLASVAGEEDPGAAIDAPAPPPPHLGDPLAPASPG